MTEDIESILVSEQEIGEITGRIADEINRDYRNSGKKLVLICILKGSLMFTAELIPNRDAGALNTLYRVANVESVEYGAETITVVALADAKARGMMRQYEEKDPE